MLDRTEIEALIPWVHRKTGFGIHNCDFAECQIEPCPRLRVILNRISDARGDDEAPRYSVRRIGEGYGIRDNLHPESHVQGIFASQEGAQEAVDARNVRAARPPQGEDHEAGIEAATEAAFPVLRGIHARRNATARVRAAIAAYFARVSPSRDCTVAEIVRRLRYSDGIAPDAAVREIADWIESQYVSKSQGDWGSSG